MNEIIFRLDGKTVQASVNLNTCPVDFLLLTSIACLRVLAKRVGREGAWEQFERGFDKAMQSRSQ